MRYAAVGDRLKSSILWSYPMFCLERHNSEAWQQGLSDQARAALETFDGWRPIITPNGLRGYVSSRYSYTPSGYRALFEKIDGEWQMTAFIEGD